MALVRRNHHRCENAPCSVHPSINRPAYHPAGIQINHHGQVAPAFVGPKIGDVRTPDLIRVGRVELALQHVLSYRKLVLTVCRYLVLALVFNLEVQRFHQLGCALTTNLKAFITQLLHHHPAAQTIPGGFEQRLHPPPQGQLLRRDHLAGPVSPVIVGTALNPEQSTLVGDRPAPGMFPDKRVLQCISLAKY